MFSRTNPNTYQLELLRLATQVHFDATFKVLPTVFYQLCTLFAPFADAAFPVVYALMSRKTQALYTGVFAKVQEFVPDFSPTSAMADFEEASAAAFQSVFGDVAISGCWFHFAQAVVKRVNKDASINVAHVRDTVHCLVALPLLPPQAILDAVVNGGARVFAARGKRLCCRPCQ